MAHTVTGIKSREEAVDTAKKYATINVRCYYIWPHINPAFDIGNGNWVVSDEVAPGVDKKSVAMFYPSLGAWVA